MELPFVKKSSILFNINHKRNIRRAVLYNIIDAFICLHFLVRKLSEVELLCLIRYTIETNLLCSQRSHRKFK